MQAKVKSHWPFWVVTLFFMVMLLVTWLLTLSWYWLLSYAVLSLITFIIYAWDKRKASQQAWRTPESTLQILALIGGWPGALLAQHQLRHKTKKTTFLLVFWAMTLLNIAALVWLVRFSTS